MEKKIEGQTLNGEKRFYTFKLMDAATGLELEYVNVGKFINNDDLMKMFSDGEFELDIVTGVKLIQDLFSFDELKDLAKKMLAGAKCQVDGENIEHQFDDSGFADFMRGDLLEFVTALAWATYANYPKALAPLLETGKSTENDSTP